MKKLSFVVSLTTNDNDYQEGQAASAEDAARRLGVSVQMTHAENDSIIQSQQLLNFLQTPEFASRWHHFRTRGGNCSAAGGARRSGRRRRLGCAES